jgi:phosphoserine phosphatase
MSESASLSSAQLTQLLEVSRMLAVTTELDPLLKRIAEACCAMLGCDRSSIFLYDESTDQLWTKVALQSGEIRVPAHAGIVGHVFKSNRVFHCGDPYKDPRFNPEPDRRTGFKTRNILAAPMLNLDRNPVGVIQAINKELAPQFDVSDESLIQLLADQAGVAIQRFHLQQKALEGVALRREMELAKHVQEDLIPDAPPEIRGITSIGWTQAASITGGDCFDLWRLNDGRLGIFVGDASGHGIGPALVVSQARTLIRAICDLEPDPTKLMEQVNARLWADLDNGRFVTAFVGFLDASGSLSWCSAGHGPMLVRPCRHDAVQLLEPCAPPLGVMQEFLADKVEPIQIELGGSLVVVSDGIFEAFNDAGEQFGVERVVHLLMNDAAGEISSIAQQIRSAVEDWQKKSEPADDQTVVIAEREPS